MAANEGVQHSPMTEMTLAQIRELICEGIAKGKESDLQKGRRRLLRVVDDLVAATPENDDATLLDDRAWKIAEVNVAGFGGIEKITGPLKLSPVPGVTVLRGNNGQGKTSLARGIDVALRGDHDLATRSPGRLWQTQLLTDGAETARADLTLCSGPTRLHLAVEFTRESQVQLGATLTDHVGARSVELPEAWRRALTGARACYSYADLQSRLIESKDLQTFLEENLLLGPCWQMVRAEIERRAAEAAAASKTFEGARKKATEQEQRLSDRFSDELPESQWPNRISWPQVKDRVDTNTWLAATGMPDSPGYGGSLHVATNHEDRIAQLDGELRAAEKELTLAEAGLDAPGMAQALDHLENVVTVGDLDGSRCPLCGSTADWRGHVESLTRALHGRSTAAGRVQRALEGLRDWVGSDLDPLLNVGVPGGPVHEVRQFQKATDLGCRGHSAAHIQAKILLKHLLEPQYSEWLVDARAATGTIAEWRSALAAIVHEFAATVGELATTAADAGIWKRAQDALDALQVGIRQSRQDVVTDHLRSALQQLLPDADVDLGGIKHRGKVKNQHGVEVDLRIGGRQAQLGMLSSGQRNALLLTPLLMPGAQGPFGFVIVDDPVHALDDTRVDLLARELVRLSAERQVIVLTHDPRLEEYLQAHRPTMNIVELDRDPVSRTVTFSEISTPWGALLTDAREIRRVTRNKSWDYSENLASVVGGMCRAAVDGALRQSAMIRAVQRTIDIAQALKDLEGARETRARIEHMTALAGGKDQLPRLTQAARSYLDFWNKGSHGQIDDDAVDLDTAITATEAACEELTTHNWLAN
ncbi:hypothetical protein [Pseudonocardia phyllosphaerae]|uniref:hypothetical protein n=1 Tax=Pseudonocardia phyllosphaerae TaxID=3390502 RepID=UPI00397D1465